MDRKEIQQFINYHKPFTKELCKLIKDLLNPEPIKYHLVESRTKKINNLVEKIERKNIMDFKKEIFDITGIRIILYYQDDLDKVEKLINDNFKVDPINSVNKVNLYKSNEFGYLSEQYIVKLGSGRAKLPEWKKFSKLNAEIQVRTILQHSWASVSHDISYKKKHDIPPELSRKLNRLAGLFELVDEQFLIISNEHKKLELEVNQLESKTLLDKDINLLTLKHNLSLPESIYNEITEIAIQSGFKISEPPVGDSSLSGIILASELLGLKTIRDIDELLRQKINEIKLLFKEMIKKVGSWSGSKRFFTMIALLYNLDENQLWTFSVQYGWTNYTFYDYTCGAIQTVKKNKSH